MVDPDITEGMVAYVATEAGAHRSKRLRIALCAGVSLVLGGTAYAYGLALGALLVSECNNSFGWHAAGRCSHPYRWTMVGIISSSASLVVLLALCGLTLLRMVRSGRRR